MGLLISVGARVGNVSVMRVLRYAGFGSLGLLLCGSLWLFDRFRHNNKINEKKNNDNDIYIWFFFKKLFQFRFIFLFCFFYFLIRPEQPTKKRPFYIPKFHINWKYTNSEWFLKLDFLWVASQIGFSFRAHSWLYNWYSFLQIKLI